MSVHKKLQQARIMLQGKQLKKSGNNKFAGYQYFELQDFLPAIQDIFNQLGLCGTINFFPPSNDMQGHARLDVVDTETNTSAAFVCPMAQASLKGCHEVQNLGASMTYIRRYLWVNALEIVEHDALDASEPLDKPKQSAKSVSADVWEGLSDEVKQDLQNIAEAMRGWIGMGNREDALKEAEHLDADQKTALWSLFDSKQRSFLKGK